MCMFYVFHLHVSLFIMSVSGAWGGQRQMSKPLELELQTAVSHNGCWESNWGLLEEPVLLAYEPLQT